MLYCVLYCTHSDSEQPGSFLPQIFLSFSPTHMAGRTADTSAFLLLFACCCLSRPNVVLGRTTYCMVAVLHGCGTACIGRRIISTICSLFLFLDFQDKYLNGVQSNLQAPASSPGALVGWRTSCLVSKSSECAPHCVKNGTNEATLASS